MITVQMTEAEYKAYQLYIKSIKVMLKDNESVSRLSSLDKYLANSENSSEIEAGLEDVKAGRITYVDPNNLWEGIK
jgi:hypothetical protein